jgi:DNA polymerase III alpha subunit
MISSIKKQDQNGKELAIRFGLGGIKAVGLSMVEETIEKQNQNGQFKDMYDFAEKVGSKIVNKKAIEALAKAGAFDSIHPNRNQIFQSTETICKYASAKENERNSNQMSLFSGSSIIEEKPALKVVENWNKEQKLQEEFKAFGFFVNEHPIDDFLDAVKKRGVVLSDCLDEMSDGNIIKLAGVVAYSKHKSGPRGRYAYLTMSDPFGIYETAIFNEELITTSRDIMADGSTLAVECLVKKDQGGFRLLVKSLEKLENFIKNNHPRKEPYQDIKQQERKEYDWKKRGKHQDNDRNNDTLALQMQIKKRNDELKNKKIFNQVNIKIIDREIVFKIKSFLSQKLAPEDFLNFTKVTLLVENQDKSFTKVELGEKYLLDDLDLNKIKSVTEAKGVLTH